MEIAAYFSLLLVLSFLLVKSADLVEDAFVLIARRLGISPFFIGFFILAAMSSLPEMSVAISSAINQAPELSVGNLIGGTFTILTLVIGVNAIVHKQIPFRGRFAAPQVLMALLILFLQIFVVLDAELRFEEGILLLAAYSLFVVYISEHFRSHKKLKENSTVQVGKLWNMMVKAVFGLLALLAISNFTVEAALVFADLIDIPSSIVGVLILGLGTNLPELAILFRSKTKDGSKLAIGNFIGSAALNTGILGALIVFIPHQLTSFTSILFPLILMGFALAAFAIFAFTDKKITRNEGVILVSLYAVMVVVEIAQVLKVI